MKKIVSAAVLLLALTASASAQIPVANKVPLPAKGTIAINVVKAAGCTVAGTGEFPAGIQLVNTGTVALPAGTAIDYVVKARSGTVKLTKILDPKATEFFNGVNPGGVEAGSPCTATVK